MAFVQEQPWFVLKVRTRSEALVVNHLRGRAYETFLPTYQEARQYSDRIKKVESPLFPGYVFCRLEPNNRLPILKTNGVEYILGANNVPEEVPVREICALQKLMVAGVDARPHPFLRRGQKVKIGCGAFAGVEGLIVQERGVDRFVLSIAMLQRSVAVEMDRTWVRPT
ncbi:MAG: transcription termination/antitermination NusG family protein [Bryobacteraceae bacterium]